MLPYRKRYEKRAGLHAKVAGIEPAGEVAAAVLRYLVDAISEVDDQPRIGQPVQAVRAVLAAELHAIVIRNQRRTSSSVLVEKFKNAVIGRYHPLGRSAQGHCASLDASKRHVVISTSHTVCYVEISTPIGKTLSDLRITTVVRTTANRSHDDLVGAEVQPDGTSIGLRWSVSQGDERMQNYNDTAENDCGNGRITAAEEGGETILMSEGANGGEWISAEKTVDVGEMQ